MKLLNMPKSKKKKGIPTPSENIEILELLLGCPVDMDEFMWTHGIGDDAVRRVHTREQLAEVLNEEYIILEFIHQNN